MRPSDYAKSSKMNAFLTRTEGLAKQHDLAFIFLRVSFHYEGHTALVLSKARKRDTTTQNMFNAKNICSSFAGRTEYIFLHNFYYWIKSYLC